MARVTLIFAFLLAVLGEAGYVETGSLHRTALIPFWFGLALGLFGSLALRAKTEKGRMVFMHINVTIGLLGFLGGVGAAIQGYVAANAQGHAPDLIALGSKLAMAVLTGIYVGLCVRSFIAVRRARQA
jgi:predicted membrane-bound spermidine synthase